MKLRLDLHVHYIEATGFIQPTTASVAQLIDTVKTRGLDGIAITDHKGYSPDFAHQVKDIVEHEFNSEILILLGQECDVGTEHVVEIYMPENRVFRFLAHPVHLPVEDYIAKDIQGVEINNGQYGIDEHATREYAQEHKLLLLSNSDAHLLDRIGGSYNEIDLDDMLKLSVSR